jgi:hypothetical protein
VEVEAPLLQQQEHMRAVMVVEVFTVAPEVAPEEVSTRSARHEMVVTGALHQAGLLLAEVGMAQQRQLRAETEPLVLELEDGEPEVEVHTHRALRVPVGPEERKAVVEEVEAQVLVQDNQEAPVGLEAPEKFVSGP